MKGCDGQCRIDVAIPEGAQTGHKVRIKGKGMPGLNSRAKGDLIVDLFVETPKNLTVRQKELMREFAQISEAQTYAQSQGLHAQGPPLLGRHHRHGSAVAGPRALQPDS